MGILIAVDGNDGSMHAMTPDGNQIGQIPNQDVFNTIGG